MAFQNIDQLIYVYLKIKMGNSSVWLTFDLSKMNKIIYYSWKEHLKIKNIAKFGREMLKNSENIAL